MFELLNGYVPLGEGAEDPYEIYDSVLEGKIVFNDEMQGMKPAKQVIKMVLHRNPAVRLRVAEGLPSHHWFRSIM